MKTFTTDSVRLELTSMISAGFDVKIEDVLVIRTRENVTKTSLLSWLTSHKNTDVRKILESKELCEHLNIQEQDIARLQQVE